MFRRDTLKPIASFVNLYYSGYMITIIYAVAPEERAAEVEWLKEQKIFPAITDGYDWKQNKPVVKFGVIVAPDAALAIKLRHKLDLQRDYKQR